jgi:hypothetical protein
MPLREIGNSPAVAAGIPSSLCQPVLAEFAVHLTWLAAAHVVHDDANEGDLGADAAISGSMVGLAQPDATRYPLMPRTVSLSPWRR